MSILGFEEALAVAIYRYSPHLILKDEQKGMYI